MPLTGANIMFDLRSMTQMKHTIQRSIERSTDFSDQRIKRIATLYLTAGFLHGVVDPSISYIGIELLNWTYEANPIMRAPMEQGLGVFILIHIPLYFGVGIAHILTVELMTIDFKQGKQSTYYAALIGLSLIIMWGLLLNIWNIAVLLAAS